MYQCHGRPPTCPVLWLCTRVFCSVLVIKMWYCKWEKVRKSEMGGTSLQFVYMYLPASLLYLLLQSCPYQLNHPFIVERLFSPTSSVTMFTSLLLTTSLIPIPLFLDPILLHNHSMKKESQTFFSCCLSHDQSCDLIFLSVTKVDCMYICCVIL